MKGKRTIKEELNRLLWDFDKKHNVSIPGTQENIDMLILDILNLFSADNTKIEVPRELLESLKNDVIELAVENNWRRNSTKWNQQYLEVLKNRIERVEELLAGKNKARE